MELHHEQVPGPLQARTRPVEAPDDTVEIEAAIFQTEGKFVDFYSESVTGTMGGELPRGNVVFRIAEDSLADVKLVQA